MKLAQSFSYIYVKTCPKVEDPREMKTILTFSLRSLWGDLEPYSCTMDVQKESDFLVIKCEKESVNQIRAALTLVTPPPYLENIVYRFDVADIR